MSRAPETAGPIGMVIDVDRSSPGRRVVTVALAGDVDVSSIPRLRAVLADHLGRGEVVLDCSGVAFCDSSILRVLVDAQQRSVSAGHQLTVRRPSSSVRALLEVSGLSRLLPVA